VTPEQELSLWEAGDLEYLVAPHARELYHWLRASDGVRQPTMVGMVSRQFGKSYVALVVCFELAMSRPHAVVTVTSSTAKSLKAYLLPNARKILARAPTNVADGIRYNSVDHVFAFPSGSTIRLTGADDMRAVDSNRGPAVDFWVVDEAGYVPSAELKSLVKDVILATFLTTRGRLVVLSSAPKQPAHYFLELRATAMEVAAYFAASIDDMPHVTPKQKAEWSAECGGCESDTYLREYKNIPVIDSSRVIVAEFCQDEARYSRPTRSPDKYELCLVSSDPGFHPDPMGTVFAYYDFRRATLVVEDELVCLKQNTQTQAEEIKGKEAALWGHLPPATGGMRPWRRTSDSANPQWAFDMQTLHRLLFLPVVKESLDGMVNVLRIRFQKGEIEIDPRCKKLIHQLRTGVWNAARTKFEHQGDSHLDLLAALVYMVRSVPVSINPYPAIPETFNPETDVLRPDIIDAKAFHSESGAAQALRALIPNTFGEA
jgi:hypothetical protein